MLCACMFEQVRGMRVHVRGMSVVRPKCVQHIRVSGALGTCHGRSSSPEASRGTAPSHPPAPTAGILAT
eukprot:1265728-Rhodomonas_salina.2